MKNGVTEVTGWVSSSSGRLGDLLQLMRTTPSESSRHQAIGSLAVLAPVVAASLMVVASWTAVAPAAVPQQPASLAPATVVTPSLPADAAEFRRRNPFRLRLAHRDGNPRSTGPEPPPAAPEVPAAPDLSARLELLGTYVSGSSRYAVIRDALTGEQDLYKVGDSPVPNHKILKIEPRGVWLTVNGRRAQPLLMGILSGSFSRNDSSPGGPSPVSWPRPGTRVRPDPGSATTGSPGGPGSGNGKPGHLWDWQIPNPTETRAGA